VQKEKRRKKGKNLEKTLENRNLKTPKIYILRKPKKKF